MSLKPKIVFGLSCIASVLVIYKVHDFQNQERERMRTGVYKDIERRQLALGENVESEQRKLHNLHMLNEQVKLTEALTENSKSN